MLVIDGVKYRVWKPKDEEKEFHPMVEKYSKQIFGKNSLFLPVEKRLISRAGRGVMPDGFAIVFSKTPEMYVVEVELSSHDLDKHIVEQLNRFGRALRNPENRKKIADRLHREIKHDLMKEAFARQMIGSKEIYKFLSDLVSRQLKTVIIIEHKDETVVEACEGLKVSPIVLQFKTFAREDAENVRAHLIEPLYVAEVIPEKGKERRGKRPLPEHYKSWKKMLQWVDESTESLVEKLSATIRNNLVNVNEVPHGRYYCFYEGKPSTKSIFAALLLTKKYVKVRIRTDPKTFKDVKKWTGEKVYRGWFFKTGQEREFKITKKDQMDYAIELIKQSYALAK